MKFISPKIDYAFKKIFGSVQSTDILISFLNAIIYGGEKVIQSLTIVNPYNPDQLSRGEWSFAPTLDIKAVLVDGSIVVIEMQVARMSGFNKRVAYNLAKAYANQLETGEDYLLLNPAIAVTITDFILFKKTEKVINKFVFQEKEKNFECLEEELQLIFVELPKFKKALSELNSLADKWIYFLKEATHLDDIPENLGEVEEIEKALKIANKINLSAEELDIVESRAIAMQDERGRIAYAEEQGEARGEVKGRQKEAISLIMVLINQRFGEVSEDIKSRIETLPLTNLESLVKVFLNFNSLTDLENWLEENS